MPEPLAIVTSYAGFIDALRARCDQLQISRETLDHVSGLTARYSAKVLVRPQPQQSMRTLGHLSFDLIIPALGLKLAVLEDETMMPRLRKRLGHPRDEAQVRTKPASTVASTNSPPGLRSVFLRTIATLGGRARASKLSPKRRIAIARRAARARWQEP
jgi:hypothetical protein